QAKQNGRVGRPNRFRICPSPVQSTMPLLAIPSLLLDGDSNASGMENGARLTINLHNGAARNRFTHSQRSRGEVVRVADVLCGDGINTCKWKSCIQRRSASSQSRRSNPTTIRVKGDVSGGSALPGHFSGERDWSTLSNLRRTC